MLNGHSRIPMELTNYQLTHLLLRANCVRVVASLRSEVIHVWGGDKNTWQPLLNNLVHFHTNALLS